ncbi:hypothetical protein BABINDRAFT_161419 [Babjeviella inositovora NRRL Y-12698]|uniref:Pre-mRNA-splicing factor CWC21 n=1 Tax=Babjeviella inositovora NRRL Y-12698 TaxID=984486 RepID=A0A1E3QPS0_9ASCO|nr:uncharacterized protein BABINDRAFT_161419 [Babjeviella inositovora NRRL Y-12698]ODQ79706.1 hypothetical protein BABINDRAFT_161419 [Babjeviella inositovora NRRL Y-12698]
MSYNGIGLQTAKGSATNGHVQRNISSIKASHKEDASQGHYSKRRIHEAASGARSRNVTQSSVNYSLSTEILDHEKKREIEVKCAELRDRLEDDDGNEDEYIDSQVSALRQKLTAKLEERKANVARKQSLSHSKAHHSAEAQEAENARLRKVFQMADEPLRPNPYEKYNYRSRDERTEGQRLGNERQSSPRRGSREEYWEKDLRERSPQREQRSGSPLKDSTSKSPIRE